MSTVEIDYDLCENSQNCEAVCPVDVFQIDNNKVLVVKPGECLLCFKCVEACPSGAIAIDY